MEAPVVPMSPRRRIVRDYTAEDEPPRTYETLTISGRQSSNRIRSPQPGSPDQRPHNSHMRSPSRQDTESIVTQIRDPEVEVVDGQRQDGVVAEKVANAFSSPSPNMQREPLQTFDFNLEAVEEKTPYAHSITSASLSQSQKTGISGSSGSRLPDIFGHEVFQIVLHNPTTAHQLLLFSQSRLCGENMEFLEKVDHYHKLLNEVTKTMFEIHRDFVSVNAQYQININESLLVKINKDLKQTLNSLLPRMESIFNDSQSEIEHLVASDVYPRFVRHQMNLSATRALAGDRGKYAGLGDCFVLTNPAKADNPIVYASDGFVKVTGYTRNDIIPRNCRFLQGRDTDRSAVQRIRASIDNRTESVELLLNYKKNGEPFWNLLYTTPLYDSTGTLVFFMGGQINCSTTIHNASDILRILSYSENVDEDALTANGTLSPGREKSRAGNFFKAFRTPKPASLPPRAPGMEPGLLTKIERMNLKSQMDVFYTAYSKYLIINISSLLISFHSPGILTLLYPSKQTQTQLHAATQGGVAGTDIFRFLGQHTLNNLPRDYKSRVKSAMKMGSAVSLDLMLCTRRHMGFEKFVTHWTPLKDEMGKSEFMVLMLGSTTA